MESLQPKKLIIVNILDILKNYTDEEHRLSQKEIADILEKEYEMKVDRKTVKRNLMNLIEFGYNIEYSETVRTIKNKSGETQENVILSDFYLVRDFTNAELRLIIDSLLFSKSIPRSQCKELIKKIERLSDKHFRSNSKHICNLPENMPQNKELFYTIEILDEAIGKSRQVSFKYNNYQSDMKQHPRLNSEGEEREYIINPYQMVATNGRYYLICNNDKYDNVANYRLDRITDIKILDTSVKPMKNIDGLKNGLNLPRHMAEHIYMFADKTQRVTFRAKKYIISEIIDWFGKDVRFTDESEDEVTAIVTVSKMAMKFWAMQYAEHITVISPDELVKDITYALESSLTRYNCYLMQQQIQEQTHKADVFCLWQTLVDSVGDYSLANEPFDKELFASAMKEAYNIFEKTKVMKTIDIQGDRNRFGMNDAIRLSGLMHEYAADRLVDYSENNIFFASQMAVRLMLSQITDRFFPPESGILDAYETLYWCDEAEKYVYNVNIGSLDGMIELVKKLKQNL